METTVVAIVRLIISKTVDFLFSKDSQPIRGFPQQVDGCGWMLLPGRRK